MSRNERHITFQVPSSTARAVLIDCPVDHFFDKANLALGCHCCACKARVKRGTSMDNDKSASLDKDSTNETSEHCYSLVQWDEVPRWQQDNHHIHGSYRRPSGSYYRSLGSLFYIHNETVNIYTHLLPALAALPAALALYKVLQPRYVQATTRDVLAFSCFFLGAAICLGMSATYHLISNHSPAVNKFGNQLDYAGIVLLISGSFVPSIYYGFWCDTTLQRFYWTMVRRV